MSSDNFPVIGDPEYYVRDLSISVEPEIGETKMGEVTIDIKMDKPKLKEDVPRFSCDCSLSIELSTHEANVDSEDYTYEEFGDIGIDLVIVVEPGVEATEDEIGIWKEQINKSERLG